MEKIKNVLIFGGNGLVGKSFAITFNNLKGYKVYSTSRNPVNEQLNCDITNENDVVNCFSISKPDIVINCTNLAGGVNFCEENQSLSQAFHYEANKLIGSIAEKINAQFVLISTDYVFDGKNVPYSENDTTNPLNAYGHHKLNAEQWITENTNRFIIARTTNVFGWDPQTKTPNFLMQLYFNLSKGIKCNAPSFLKGNPTYVYDLTNSIISLLTKKSTGIYHIVGQSNINRYDWALKFCKSLNFNESLINELKDVPESITPRPLNSNLNTDKLAKEIGEYLSSVDEGLTSFIKDMKSNE